MISIVLCEDDKNQLDRLTQVVENFVLFHEKEFELSIATNNPKDCLDKIISEEKDHVVYFLDIDLSNSISGIDLAIEIRKRHVESKIAFITTHEEMAPLTLQKQIEPINFIEKDFGPEKIRDEVFKTLELSKERFVQERKPSENFSFYVGSSLINIDIRDVLMLEPSSIPHRIVLHCKNQEYEFYGKLSEIDKDYSRLFRSSKSSLINVENIQKYDLHSRIIFFANNISCKCSVMQVKALRKQIAQNN
ncbi:LytR/AlgR family response regulator transcription factor [Companilactobacillus mishanensis]|uniref:Response regulator transcription factor n=1 Tax=Companilactobacillus mishanensis TaxID=2486008 RepID=A0A5P0ZIT6_9LACO|nr:LytTR family DNA-binding domain-containing protein [Companilactobacillus mishanensis]MQS52925.1 response regulator transcription factor [Companilactobacillus mishanensis]